MSLIAYQEFSVTDSTVIHDDILLMPQQEKSCWIGNWSAGSILRVLLGLFLTLPAVVSHAATYLGGEACRSCHESEYAVWQGSHHDLAMQPASVKTVLGNFNNVTFTQFGVTSYFYKKNDRFMVRTSRWPYAGIKPGLGRAP